MVYGANLRFFPGNLLLSFTVTNTCIISFRLRVIFLPQYSTNNRPHSYVISESSLYLRRRRRSIRPASANMLSVAVVGSGTASSLRPLPLPAMETFRTREFPLTL